jgi:hypothetical protein
MIFLYLKNACVFTVFLKNAKIERFSYKLFRSSVVLGFQSKMNFYLASDFITLQ